MQRMMETLLDRRGLAVWVEDRMLRLLKDGATVHMARAYADYVYRKVLDFMRVVGDPLVAGHYREGHELAAHELGDLTVS